MELRKYLNVLLKWWWLILASVIVASIVSFFGARSTPRTYLSRTTLMVGQALQNPNPSQSEVYIGEALAQSYIDLARREPVLRAALNTLQLDWDWVALQNMVTTRIVPGTQLIEISVLDTDPKRAQVLAAEIANQLIQQSPAGNDPERDAERAFISTQIETLKTNIEKAQAEIRQLDEVIAQAPSARQIQDARSRQAALQAQVSTWQTTFTALRTNLQIGTPNFLSVVEPAQVPTDPVGSSLFTNVLLAAAIGFTLAASAALVLEYLDDSLRTSEDVRDIIDLPTIGAIAKIPGNSYKERLITTQPRSPAAESYRVLRTNLQFSGVDHALCTCMITSAGPGEGKSLTAANLAIVIAQAGKRVVLVDADLRRPTQHQIFGLSNNLGLTSVLVEGPEQLNQALQNGPIEGLQILTCGPLPPNPSELLGSHRMEEIIQQLCGQVEMVIFDSPPVMAVADASVLAARLDGTLLVVESGRTRRGAARRSWEALQAVNARLPGVVLNRCPAHREKYYYYYAEDDGSRQQQTSRQALTAHLITRMKQLFARRDATIHTPVTKSKPERS